jgi:hypothetical protein
MKACIRRLTSGIDHPGQERRLLDPVVEHREVLAGRAEGRAHQEGGTGKVAGDLARRAFDAEDFTDDQIVALLGIFAHHALIVGVGDVLGIDVLDLAAILGGVQRLVDPADPLLLDRHGVDGRDLDLAFDRLDLGNGPRGQDGRAEAGGTQHGDAGQHGATGEFQHSSPLHWIVHDIFLRRWRPSCRQPVHLALPVVLPRAYGRPDHLVNGGRAQRAKAAGLARKLH